MTTALDRIIADKRRRVDAKSAAVPRAQLEQKLKDLPPTRGFISAIAAQMQADKPALIAEVKKASPSKGVIRADFDPASIACAYQEGGAACLSVLTDAPYFQGQDDDLARARAQVALPVLRKDFMIDPYQIVESRILGADCVLLIMAALDDDTVASLHALAVSIGLDVLVEVHDRAELDRAARLSPGLLGVNCRNLKTLELDLSLHETLLPYFPQDTLRVAESGIASHERLQTLWGAGYDAFLVGEGLMRQPDITAATRALMQGA